MGRGKGRQEQPKLPKLPSRPQKQTPKPVNVPKPPPKTK